jgi:hypothetical protein
LDLNDIDLGLLRIDLNGRDIGRSLNAKLGLFDKSGAVFLLRRQELIRLIEFLSGDRQLRRESFLADRFGELLVGMHLLSYFDQNSSKLFSHRATDGDDPLAGSDTSERRDRRSMKWALRTGVRAGGRRLVAARRADDSDQTRDQ